MFLTIRDRRELFVDGEMIEETDTNEILHHPVRRELIMNNQADGWVYYTVINDHGLFRMYYLSMPMYSRDYSQHNPPYHHICYAESTDGIHWVKPSLGLCEYEGSKDNNILFITDTMDAFHVFMDPNAPAAERYKSVFTKPGHQLWCATSSDGIRFTDGWMLTDKGHFDSHNTAFWDENRKQYVCYSRDFHPGSDGIGVRDIRRQVSDDFRHWSEPEMISYTESDYDFQMYTNGIQPYFRAPHIYLGFPARYVERPEWTPNYDELCGAGHRKWRMQYHKRFGLAVTDGLFMSSRDGISFRRWNEAFVRPGPESAKRWAYGDCYLAYGMLLTDVPGEDSQLSFYADCNNWSDTPTQVYRYSLRTDGFVSRSAGYAGASLITKPFSFIGDSLKINFETSAAGSVRVQILDGEGHSLEGFDSGELFGDSISRNVRFSGRLAELAGRPVRMKMELRDADVYAFRFETTV